MRFVTFDDFTPGLLREDEVVDLTPALGDIARLPWDERIPTMIAEYARLKPAIERLAASGPGIPIAQIHLRAPNPRPGRILCGMWNYNSEPGKLDFLFKSPESVIGPGDTIQLPKAQASSFQPEAALAFIIGRQGRNVPEADGSSYIFGYTGFIDVYGRDLGRPVGTYLGKSFDTFGPMGPCILTADEVRDPHDLRVRLSVKGKVRQDYSTSSLVNRLPAQVATATAIMTLYPGDMITCGTDENGVAPIQHGDNVLLDIPGIGGLRVEVNDPLGRSWPRD
jgi:2-keto-4-pentenoate hydratase/2-oxohepta-3-ene-1,7-dioic acid hydratase in catechol pathway